MNKSKFLSRFVIFFCVITIMALGCVTSDAQYLETFSTPNKGYKINCQNDITGILWGLSAWDPTGSCRVNPPDPVTDLRDPTDYFNTTAAGVLESIDLDQEVCWNSPVMNIASAGPVTVSVDLTWVGFDTDIAANNCSGDYIRVSNSINGGAFNMVPNVVGGDACATVAYPFGAAGAPFNSSTTVTQSGLTGTTLVTKVCVFTNANAEVVTIDNVRAPQAGVRVPTAAGASISGRVTTADGRSIRGAAISVSGGNLPQPRIARTSSFGYYSLEDLDAGQTYVVTVGSKRYMFSAPSRVVSLTDSIADADFVADPMQ